jgi:transcription antitermination factor NusG
LTASIPASIPIGYCAEPPDPDSPWFVLRTKTNFEQAVCSELFHYGIQAITLTTKIKARDRRTHRPAIIERPLWPGYALARFTPAQRPMIRSQISYVIDILRFGISGDARVSPDELANVRTLLSSGAPLRPRLQIMKGQKVRVIKGCMAGLIGEYVHSWGEDIVVVNLPFFGRSLGTPISEEMIEVVSDAPDSL